MEESEDKKQSTGQMAILGLFIFLFVIVLFNNPLWSNPKGARVVLEEAGYSNVEILPYRFFYHCGRNGPVKTQFKATAADGKAVSGAICNLPFANRYIKIDKAKKSKP